MSHLYPTNTIKLTTATKQIDLSFMRPAQMQYLHNNIFNSIVQSELVNDRRITIISAGSRWD